LNSATEEICVWLPIPELPTVTCLGRDFASAMSSPRDFHFESAHRDHRRLDQHPRHRVEAAVVERQHSGVESGGDRIGIPDDGIPVGLLRCDVLVADRAPGARAIDHEHLGAELLRHPVGEQPRRDVGRRTGGKEHRDLDRGLLRERRLLRCGGRGKNQRRRGENRNLEPCFHEFLLA